MLMKLIGKIVGRDPIVQAWALLVMVVIGVLMLIVAVFAWW